MKADDSMPFAEFARRVLLVGALIVLGLLVWQLKSVLLLVFAGALFAIVLRTLAVPLAHQTPLRTTAALAVVVVGVLAGMVAIAWLLGAQIMSQLAELTEQLPKFADRAREFFEETELGRALLRPLQVSDNLFGRIGAQALSAANITFAAIADIVIIIFLGLFFAFNPRLYVEGASSLVPSPHRERAREVLWRTGEALRRWLLAQFAAMLAVGALTWIALTLLGVPLALALSFVAFLLEFVPIIGPIVAAVPAVLVGLSVDPMLGLWVALAYFGIQQIESYTLVPLLQRWAVSIPPALTLISVVVFGILFGWAGVILATPLMVTTILWVKMIYLEDVMHRPSGEL